MKKKFKYGLILVIIFLVPTLKVKALCVDENNLTIAIGENKSFDLYVDVEQKITDISFNFVYSTFDIPASLNVDSAYTSNINGIKYSIKFDSSISGKVKLGKINVNVDDDADEMTGEINLNTVVATLENGTKINLNSQTIVVTVGEDNTPILETSEDEKQDEYSKKELKNEEKKHLLKEIKSNIVDIKLKDNVFEYNVFVKESENILDLQPIAINKDYKIDITTQKISELKDGKILITVSNDDIKEIYTINIEQIKIDTQKSKIKKEYKSSWIGAIIGSVIVMVIGVILARKK